MTDKAVAVIGASPLAPILSDPEKLNALDVDKLERLLDMQREITAKQEQQAFLDALADFQAACPPIDKPKTVYDRNGKKLYDFAPLDYIIRVAGPHLRSAGFVWRFNTEPQEQGTIVVECTLTHVGGHSESCAIRVPPLPTNKVTNAAQSSGQQVSYGRRYAFTGVTGLQPTDEDTDAIPVPGQDYERITDSQAADLSALLQDANANMEIFFSWASESSGVDIRSLSHFPAAFYDQAVAKVNQKLARAT